MYQVKNSILAAPSSTYNQDMFQTKYLCFQPSLKTYTQLLRSLESLKGDSPEQNINTFFEGINAFTILLKDIDSIEELIVSIKAQNKVEDIASGDDEQSEEQGIKTDSKVMLRLASRWTSYVLSYGDAVTPEMKKKVAQISEQMKNNVKD